MDSYAATGSRSNVTMKHDNPFTMIPDHVFWHPELSKGEVQLYALIFKFEHMTGKVYFSNKYAAEKLGVTVNGVQKMSAKLKRFGLIHRDPQTHRWKTIKPGDRMIDVDESVNAGVTHSVTGGILESMGGYTTVQGGVYSSISNINKSKHINKNNNATGGRSGVVSSDNVEDLEEDLRDERIQAHTMRKLVNEHGKELVTKQLKNLDNQQSVKNPGAWLQSACKHDYECKINSEASTEPQEWVDRYAKPKKPSFQELLSRWFKLRRSEKTKIAREVYSAFFVYRDEIPKLDDENYVEQLTESDLDNVLQYANRQGMI